MGRTESSVAGFEIGRGKGRKDYEPSKDPKWSLESGKDKETVLSFLPPERNVAQLTP